MAYYIKYRKWWDTKTFTQAGKLFSEAEKMGSPSYCPFPKNTLAYKEFWDEQLYYIHNGYYHDGQRTSGLHYLYTNYCPIRLKKEKRNSFPYFYVVDAEYFLHMEKFLGLGPWVDFDPYRPVTMSVAKARQTGFSLKGCVPLIYNVQFVPGSINYLGAWLDKDAKKTLAMFHNYFDHQFKYTDFGKRWLSREKGKHFVTGYQEDVGGEGVDAGFKSELHIVTFKDNTTKGVGGSCDLFVVEEGALHPEVDETIQFIEPACKDGDYTTGNILVYGAAAKDLSKAFQKVHENPDNYHAYKFKNVFDEPKERLHEYTGLFVPDYSCRPGHMDEDGNPNCETAIAARNKELDSTKKKDYIKWLLDVSQHPNTPREMFSSIASKRFDGKAIDRQIAFILAHSGVPGEVITLTRDPETGRLTRTMGSDHPAIHDYPYPSELDKHGAIVIYEEPSRKMIRDLYIAAIDSYNQQTSSGSSLGSIFIFKKTANLSGETTHRILVAEYIGRPDNKYDFYEICRCLLEYYNAIALHENEDHELTPWFINNNCEHLLADSPDIIRQYIPNSTVKRTKGIHADDKLIIPAENKIQRYLTEVIGIVYNDEGIQIGQRMGVGRILSLGLLRELKEYATVTWKNFDRVRAFGWLLMYEEETLQKEAQHEEEYSDFLSETERFKPNKEFDNDIVFAEQEGEFEL